MSGMDFSERGKPLAQAYALCEVERVRLAAALAACEAREATLKAEIARIAKGGCPCGGKFSPPSTQNAYQARCDSCGSHEGYGLPDDIATHLAALSGEGPKP